MRIPGPASYPPVFHRVSGRSPAARVYHGRPSLFPHRSPVMPTSSPALPRRDVRALGAPDAAASARELLERFSRGRDEGAFTALLRRHGPMVWRACRRVVPRPADAEDAFQATF